MPPLIKQQKHCQLMRIDKKQKEMSLEPPFSPQRPLPLGKISADLMVVSGLVSGQIYEEQKTDLKTKYSSRQIPQERQLLLG